jgi:peptide/nickel transport system substrate-binding protein
MSSTRTRKLSRRELLRLAGASTLATIAAACAAPTPQLIKETVLVQGAPAKETVIVAGTPEVKTVKETVMVQAPAAKIKQAVILPTHRGGGFPFNLWTGVKFWTGSAYWSRVFWEPLFDVDDNLAPIPALADKWEAKSPTQLVIYLKQGLKWSDGEPLTADDVVWSLNYTLQKDLGGWTGKLFPTIVGAKDLQDGKGTEAPGIKKLDDFTIMIETEKPTRDIVKTLAVNWWAPLPKHVVGNIAAKDWKTNYFAYSPTVFSGPFQLDKRVEGKWFELSKNPNYYLLPEYPKLDKVLMVNGDMGDIQALMAQQKFDFSGFNEDMQLGDAAAANPNYTVQWTKYIQPWRMLINPSHPRLKDPNIRKALAYAYNPDPIYKTVFKGRGKVEPCDFWGGLADPKAEMYSYNPDKARELLKKTDWDMAKDTLTFAYDWGVPGQTGLYADLMVALAQVYKDFGFKVATTINADAAANDKLFKDGSWSLDIGCWTRVPEYGVTALNERLRCVIGGGLEGQYQLNWCSEETNKLIDQATSEVDDAKYKAVVAQLSVMFQDACYWVDVFYQPVFGLTSKRFKMAPLFGDSYLAYRYPHMWDVTD